MTDTQAPTTHTTDDRGVIEVHDIDAYLDRFVGADVATDEACGRSWDDSVPTAYTPAPAGRCPFEDEHEDDDEPATITEWEAERQFEEWLGDTYETVNICGYDFDAGRALKELDPIAFREGMLDYFNGLDIEIV